MIRIRPLNRHDPVVLYGAAAVAALVLGYLLARGHLYLAAAGLLGAGLAVVLTIQALGYRALTWWVVGGLIAYPFLRYPHGHSQLTFDRVWILGLAAAALAAGQEVIRRDRLSRRLGMWVGLLAVTMLIRGLSTSGNRQYAISVAVDAGVLPAILFFAARRLMTDATKRAHLIRSFAVAGAILGLIAVGERLLGFQLATLSGGAVTTGSDVGVRVSGPYANDDVLATALLMCLAATFYWIQSNTRSRLIVGSGVVLLELAGIALTFFRGAWIAALVVIVVGVGLRPRRYARLAGTVALVAVVAGVLLLGAQSTTGVSQRVNDTQNVNGRVAVYQEGVALFLRHPLAGVGLAQFATAQQTDLAATSYGGVTAARSAHNSYLDLMGEGGALVALPFLGLTIIAGMFIHRFRKLAREEPNDVRLGAMIAAAALAYLLLSLEETVIISSTASNAFLALLLGTCAARLDSLNGRNVERSKMSRSRYDDEKRRPGVMTTATDVIATGSNQPGESVRSSEADTVTQRTRPGWRHQMQQIIAVYRRRRR